MIPGESHNEYDKAVPKAVILPPGLLETDLSGANLSGADLSGVNLSRADLSGANLSRADLSGATGISNEELEHQALTLAGATMPDGSDHP
jgi:uncharacterized protein YjbI with pentapeptide repeats